MEKDILIEEAEKNFSKYIREVTEVIGTVFDKAVGE